MNYIKENKMKLLPKEETTFNVELTKEEIMYIRSITQNSMVNPDEEDEGRKKLRLSLFVGASRILGFDVNDDGTTNRNTLSINGTKSDTVSFRHA